MPFGGVTYERDKDYVRLSTLLMRVQTFMSDKCWHTLPEIQSVAGGSEASCSARLRDMRKDKFGGSIIERRRRSVGLFEYRLGVRIIDRIQMEFFP